MLRNICYSLSVALLILNSSSAFANTCGSYFRGETVDTVFENRIYDIVYTEQQTVLTIERTPVQAYALEVEAATILKGLKAKGPKYLLRFKSLIESNSIIMTKNVEGRPIARTQQRIKDLALQVETLESRIDILNDMRAESKEEREIFVNAVNDTLATLQSTKKEITTILKDAQNLAFRLDVIREDVIKLPIKTVQTFSAVRAANLQFIRNLNTELQKIEPLTNDATRILNPGHTGPGSMLLSRSRSFNVPHLPEIQKYATPVPEPRSRLSQTAILNLKSEKRLEQIQNAQSYEVTLNVAPSKLTGQLAYKTTLEEFRSWARTNGVIDGITFSHSGFANKPVTVTITDKAPEGLLKRFLDTFANQITSAAPVSTKTLVYYNIKTNFMAKSKNKAKASQYEQISAKEATERLQNWINEHNLHSEITLSYSKDSSEQITQMTITSSNPNFFIESLKKDLGHLVQSIEKTNHKIDVDAMQDAALSR